MIPLIPESAPFTPEQRAWLNGFLAGVLGLDGAAPPPGIAAAVSAARPASAPESSSVPATVPGSAAAEEESFPWHDPALSIEERMALAAGMPLERRLMAAMAQLDCGACGYACKTYSGAIARGEEKRLTLCVPGGRETASKLRAILAAEGGSPRTAVALPPPPAAPAEAAGPRESGGDAPRPGSSRASPYPARVIRSAPLTGARSTKATRFVALDLDGSGIAYEPGDSLGVFPENCPELVSAVMAQLGAGGEEEVPGVRGRPVRLRDALLAERTIARADEDLLRRLEAAAARSADGERLRQVLGNGVGEYLDGRDLLDVLAEFPSARPPIAELIESLPALEPRLYSISSSLRAHSGEAHLTVGVVRYENHGRPRQGVASTFLGERVREGARVDVFLHPSRFKLPADGAVPIIMIGPGTGVAPFRAFLQERLATGARGRNWLFFGERQREHDFLYREELEAFVAGGLLTRLDTAFSRDQGEKVYVQHRLLEHGRELWSWIEEGAHVYVCGDASRMARDVDAALGRIAAEHGGMSADAAAERLRALARERRYQRDVY